MNAYIKNYREALAKSGRVDDRPDDILTWEEGNWARQNAPQLFEKFPDFAAEWGQLRENNAPGLMEEGTRAFKRAGIGLGSTALGGAALITGNDYLKRKAAALSMQASDPDLAPTIPTLEDIRPGEDGPGQAFSRDTLRYGISKVGEAVPSIGEAVALGLVGGAIGSAVEPGAGTVVGAGAGAVEGLIGRGIIRKAIKSLVSKQLSEDALIAGLRKGVPEVVEAVTKNAKSLAGARAGTVTAGINSFVLNAGDVYSENDDRGVAAGLGLISAIPDTVLPALIVKKMFPGVSLKTGKEAARELVGSNALKVAKAAGVTSFEGATESFQEAVNVVARNLKNNVDPMTVTDDDRIRIREAGITGAVGGALASPAVVLERDAEDVTMAPEAPPAPPAAPTVAPLVPPVAPIVPVTVLPTQRVRNMTPEQQVARLAELEAKVGRSADEEAEYQILRATVPAVAVQPATPEAAAAVAAGNMPLAPTPVAETPLTPVAPTESGAEEITLYHGGPKPDGPLREPVFLTTEKQGAEWYAGERGGETGTVSEFTAKIRNPLNIDEAAGINVIVKAAKDAGVPVEITGEIGTNGWGFFSPEISKHGPYDGGSVADLAYVPKVREALRNLGYDAIRVSDMLENNFIDTYVVLDPTALKPKSPTTTLPEPGAIATPQPTIATDEAEAPVQGEFEPVDIGDRSGRPQGAAEQAVVDAQRVALGLDGNNRPVGTLPAARTYSRLNQAVENSPQAKASGAQWKATIRNSKAGINQDEYALVGVGDLEDGRVYTKQEVVDYLKANEITVEDVTLGSRDEVMAADKRLTDAGYQVEIEYDQAHITDKDGNDVSLNDLPLNLREDAEIVGGRGEVTHFEQYTLPGATEGTYREVLLTVPEKARVPDKLDSMSREEMAKWYEREVGYDPIKDAPDTTTEGLRSHIREYIAESKGTVGQDVSSNSGWRDGHSQYSSIANPIVRIRLNERTTTDGKRILFLEEVQAPQKSEFEKMPALFQKNWREIAFKWALNKAAASGFDAIGWTTGEQQAERYDLSKQVEAVRVTREVPGTYAVEVQTPGNRGFRTVAIGISGNKLEDHIGKELTAKVLSSPNERVLTYSGLDLKVGGEGLKKLYDSDFRNVVNGLAVVKKSGQKVGTGMIASGEFGMDGMTSLGVRPGSFSGFWVVEGTRPDGTREQLSSQFSSKNDAEKAISEIGIQKGSSIHLLPITDQMRAAVEQGQPRFRGADQTQTPEFQRWFAGSKVVDAKGKPLVVYHGTPDGEIAQFDGNGRGAFFTSNPRVADGYTAKRGMWMSPGKAPAVYPVHLSIKNPLVIDALGKRNDNIPVPWQEWKPKVFGNLPTGAVNVEEAFKYAVEHGHDGVIIKDVVDTADITDKTKSTVYGVVAPTQVKSAIGNRGTFDPANPDITARTSTEPTNPAVQAQRTQEFQRAMGRMVSNGANVQILSQELLAQQTGEVLQQQIAALQARLAAATTAPQRNELTQQIAIREQRMAEVAQMRGVTFNPYHIAVAMDDVMNASLDNLVTLLHEAAESLTMRLTPAQQGAVFRAVEAASAQMQARMQAAAKNTGATVADVPVPSELLAETMAQALAAEGIPESTSLAEAIVRWVKEIYYRVAMAAQRSFGAEPSISLTLDWYENQLRRELGGDYEYSLANLLDRFLPQPNQNFTAKFSGASGTPGGIPDFFDPTTQTLKQPWVEPLSDEALAWNMKFQTVGVNPGESGGISAEEAVARQAAASYNDQIEWLTKLRNDIAPTMDEGEFLGLVSRGEKTPQQLLAALEEQRPGVSDAKIGGERMTDAMNKWAAWQSLKFMKGVQEKHLSRIASMQESVKEADERFTEHATELNRLEPDVRNAELHEAELKTKFRGILNGLLKSYGNGLRTASKLGGIEEMLNNEEGVRFGDPLPQFYAQAFANLLNADIKLFDYVEAIALLDLPIEDMTAEQVWKAIRENKDSSEKLQELTRNKPLAMTIAVLARNSARQLDQIQLRKADPATFLDVRRELEGIRNATEAQLREMIRSIDDKNKAKGLRQRLRTNYLKERRAMQRASDRIAAVEERVAVLEKAKPAVAEKINEMQQAIGGVFSEWVPFSGAEFTVMRRKDDGSYQKTSRTLEFKPDGSAVDADGLVTDLAMNWQWLKANTKLAGQREYEQVKHQTRELQAMDVQRAYPAHNYGKIMGMIDGFVRPLQAIAKQAGHASGNRIVQQFNKYGFILRSGEKALTNLSYEWTAARAAVMKAVGIEDVGQFHARIYNPVMFYLGVNPGLDKSQAIRGATALARKKLTTTPPANFNEKFEAFLLKDKQLNDELKRTAETNGVLVWDEKLGELRKALDRGWNTGMRMMNDGVVVTLINDMEKAGWKLEFDRDAQKQNKKVVTRSTTFDALNPKKATTPAERADYYSQLENTDALRAALKPYFTPAIIERWLLPFINKPGESVFSHDGRDISQIDLQNAWAKSGGDVVTWIDNLGQMIDISPEEDASDAATFRWDMLRQMEHLFKWEAKMAYEASQTPDLFDNQGSKLHVMMDARVNDLMPEEHVNFAQHDPTSVRQMLGQIAFHGAFGRNGMALNANLTELGRVSHDKKAAFEMLRSTTVEGKKREARDNGFDYDELKRAVSHYHDVLELKGEIEAAMGVKNIYGPLYDARAGMELLGFMVGQVVDQPKTAALNFLSIGARPFAMHSFSPKVLKATGLAYGELAKNTFGGMLHDFGIDLVRESEYAKETGEVEGKAFRRLPWGTVFAGDTGKNGSFQDSLSQRFGVQPLRILRAFQKKGVGPGVAAIPGLGTMQRFATEGAKANNIGQIFLLQQIINNGIRHFSAHPEDLANPAFRFDANNLKLKADRGMYDWFRNKTVEYNMGPIEKIVRDSIERQKAGERTITTEMVEQLAQMNAQELDGASSINTAPAGLAQNQALKVMLPLLRWPLWMMHAAHEGLADANGRADFKSMMRGLGRLAAWNLPLGLAFTFLIDEYDEKILKKKNAMPQVSPWAAVPVAGLPLALATSPRDVPTEAIGIAQRMIRSGNIYGLGGDAAQLIIAPFDPGSGQRQFSLDQRVLVMSQLLNMTQAIGNWFSQGVPTWGSVYRPMVASIGGNGMLNSLDVANNLLGLDNAESRLTQRINSARWINTAAKELGYETKKTSGFSSPTPLSVWTREMQLAAMANDRADFMEAYRKALDAAREKVAEDDRIPVGDREREAMQRVLAGWRARNPFSGLAQTPTPEQKAAMLRIMNDAGRADVQDAVRYYDAYTRLIAPSEMDRLIERRMRAADPMRQMETMRRRAASGMMAQ